MELDEAEQKLGVKLPLDLRCVYRIHNGQMKLHNMSSLVGYFETFLSYSQWCNRGECRGMTFPQIFIWGNAIPQVMSGKGGMVIQ